MPQPTYKDLRRFCEIDGWEQTASARGKTPDHFRYRKLLKNGRVLRTKVSHGSGSVDSPGLWAQIWKKQLALPDEETFWATLKTGQPVTRPEDAEAEPPAHTLPADLVWQLVNRVGIPEQEVLSMSLEEAIARLTAHYSSGGSG